MTFTYPIGTLSSVASLLTATLDQDNPDMNHKFWTYEQKTFAPYAEIIRSFKCTLKKAESTTHIPNTSTIKRR